jgi:hypothetical protein
MAFRDIIQDLSESRGTGTYKVPKWAIAGAGVIALGVGIITSVHTLDSTEGGVKYNKWFGGKEVLSPGQMYIIPPLMYDVYRIDVGFQHIEMKNHMKIGKDEKTVDNRLIFKTKDGNDIATDVTVSWMVDAQHPYRAIENAGQSIDELSEKVVNAISRSNPRDWYGALSTREFSDAGRRKFASENTAKQLTTILQPYGIIVSTVQTGDFEFLNEDFKKLVQRMKVAEGKLPTVRSGIKAQDQENLRMLNDAEGIKNQKTAEADGYLAGVKVVADSYFTAQQNNAAGLLAEGRNIAAAIKKEREAAASGAGEANLRMRIAQNTKDIPKVMFPQCADGNALTIQNQRDYLNMLGLLDATKEKP